MLFPTPNKLHACLVVLITLNLFLVVVLVVVVVAVEGEPFSYPSLCITSCMLNNIEHTPQQKPHANLVEPTDKSTWLYAVTVASYCTTNNLTPISYQYTNK